MCKLHTRCHPLRPPRVVTKPVGITSAACTRAWTRLGLAISAGARRTMTSARRRRRLWPRTIDRVLRGQNQLGKYQRSRGNDLSINRPGIIHDLSLLALTSCHRLRRAGDSVFLFSPRKGNAFLREDTRRLPVTEYLARLRRDSLCPSSVWGCIVEVIPREGFCWER